MTSAPHRSRTAATRGGSTMLSKNGRRAAPGSCLSAAVTLSAERQCNAARSGGNLACLGASGGVPGSARRARPRCGVASDASSCPARPRGGVAKPSDPPRMLSRGGVWKPSSVLLSRGGVWKPSSDGLVVRGGAVGGVTELRASFIAFATIATGVSMRCFCMDLLFKRAGRGGGIIPFCAARSWSVMWDFHSAGDIRGDSCDSAQGHLDATPTRV
mmetsp:Transcript_27149/g.59719  ORF Transcript_27149/g.59719 Transcript_27149/m.59719 type:complete len:215 (+) Transcript_27149:832-1476(+)